jgi:hypothetical protein
MLKNVRFRLPNLSAFHVPFTNIAVSFHRVEDHGGVRHWAYEDASGGELQVGRTIMVYGIG